MTTPRISVDPWLAPLNDADRQLMADLGLTADESYAGGAR